MKSGIHPAYHPVIFKDGENELIGKSTTKSNETRDIDGVSHFIIHVEISAMSHPFFTGKQKIMDTEGRVERFRKRYNIRG